MVGVFEGFIDNLIMKNIEFIHDRQFKCLILIDIFIQSS